MTCGASVTLRFFMISPFTGDFAHISFERSSSRLCRQLRMCAQEHARADAFEEAQWFQPRRMGSFWFGGVLVFVRAVLAAAELPRKHT
jgi:hypothetical protein